MEFTRQHPDYYPAIREEDTYQGGERFYGKLEDYMELLPFERKNSEGRRNRMLQFQHFNYTKSIVDNYVGIGFRKDPSIESDQLEDDQTSNIDGTGTDLVDQMKNVNSMVYRQGLAFLLVDQDPISDELSQAEVNELAPPRIIVLDRPSIINWSKDRSGMFNWVSIRHLGAVNNDPLGDREVKEFITLYRKDVIQKYELVKKTDSTNQKDWVLVGESANPFAELGIVPIIPVKMTKESTTFITDISRLNIKLDNVSAMINDTLRKLSVIIPEYQKGTEIQGQGIEKVYIRGEDDEEGLQFRSPSNESTETMQKERDMLIDILNEISNQDGTEQKLVSGVSRYYDFIDQEAVIKNSLRNLQEAYQKALTLLIYLANGGNIDIESIEVEIEFDTVSPFELRAKDKRYIDLINPEAPHKVNLELYRSAILAEFSGILSVQKIKELNDQIDAIQPSFWATYGPNPIMAEPDI